MEDVLPGEESYYQGNSRKTKEKLQYLRGGICQSAGQNGKRIVCARYRERKIYEVISVSLTLIVRSTVAYAPSNSTQ